MRKRRWRSILASAVAGILVIQAVFAANVSTPDSAEELLIEENTSMLSDENAESFMFDEDGNIVTLASDFDYEATLAGDKIAETEDYKAGDAGVVYFEDFEKYNEGEAEGVVNNFKRLPYTDDESLYQTTTNAKIEKGTASGNDTKYLAVNIPSDENSSAAKNTDFVLSFAGMDDCTSVIENGVLEISFKAMSKCAKEYKSGIISCLGKNASDTSTAFPGTESVQYIFERSKSTYYGYYYGLRTSSATLGVSSVEWHEYTAVLNVENGVVTGIDHFVDNALVAENKKPSKDNAPAPGLLRIRPEKSHVGSTVYVDDVTVVSYKKKIDDNFNKLNIQDTYTESFKLPTTVDGMSVVYNVEESPYITVENGKFEIIRPAREDVQVKLYAEMSYDNGGSFPITATNEKTIILPRTTEEGAFENELAREDLAAIEVEGINLFNISEDFAVPVKGSVNNSDITWTSNSEWLSIDKSGTAKVKRPPYNGQIGEIFVITATVKYGNSEVFTRNFDVRVLEAEPLTDEEKVQYEKKSLKIDTDLTDVRSNFSLPHGEYAEITWASDNNAIEIVEDNMLEITRAKVTQPVGGEAEVTLTATITSGDVTDTKEFTAIVKSSNVVKAFPGAEGYGAYTKGGRDGYVYHVTNLSGDSETEGSLAYGIEKLTGARTIVFDVAGTIDLTEKGEAIKFKGENGSNITIAGQTAPYPGIQLKGYGITMENVHDVVIRHIRVRIGDVLKDGEFAQMSPLSVSSTKNTIIDHCSFTWAVDMGIVVTGENITMSNSIISKGLDKNSPHDMGGGHDYAGTFGSRKASFIKNYVSDSSQRSPRLVDGEYVDAYNNLLYNNNYGFDVTNYEYMNKNVLENVHDNFAQDGPGFSNRSGAFIRINRGRDYAGGVLLYGQRNFSTSNSSDAVIDNTGDIKNYLRSYYPLNRATTADFTQGGIKYTLQFGNDNTKLINGDTSNYPEEYDLSNVTLDEWVENPLSYDNNNKTVPGGTLTFLPYPLPAPRANLVNNSEDGYEASAISIFEYVTENAGATKPARDLQDEKFMAEAESKTGGKASLSKDIIQKYCDEMNIRTQSETIYDIDEVMAVITNPEKPEGYEERWSDRAKDYAANGDNHAYGDGRSTNNLKPTIYKNEGDKITWSVSAGEGPIIVGAGSDKLGGMETPIAIKWDDSWWEEFVGFPINGETIYHTNADIPAEYRTEEQNANLGEIIVWDSMGDGIPDWYKDIKGWDKTKAINNEYLENGYTCLDDYLAFMAGDEEFETAENSKGTTAENFKVNKLSYSTAQPYWNTSDRAKCTLYYGTEQGTDISDYENSEILEYTNKTDGYHTYHSIVLSELDADTTYYYRVAARDEFGVETISEEQSFTTDAIPERINEEKPVVATIRPYENQVYLKWTGNVETDEAYRIKYGTESGNYTNTTEILDREIYEATVTGLENGVRYYFVVEAINESGVTNSEEISAVPSNLIVYYDYSNMTEDEQEKYLLETFIYKLGGTVEFKEKEVAGGKTVLEYHDNSKSHNITSWLNFPENQTDVFTTEIQLMVERYKPTFGTDANAIFNLNFYTDNAVDEEGSSLDSRDFTQAYSVLFDQGDIRFSDDTSMVDGDTIIAEYNTIKVPYTSETSTATREEEDFNEKVSIPLTMEDVTSGRVEWIDLKIVTDCVNNSITIYKNNEEVASGLKFSEEITVPYNVGRIEFKTRNDGTQVTSIESVKVYSGTELLVDDEALVPPVNGVRLDAEFLTLNIGERQTLTATVLPTNALNREVTWTSSDETVAAVSSEGEVTARAVGSTIVTATTVEGGKTATCEVTVTEATVIPTPTPTPIPAVDKTALKAAIDTAKMVNGEDYTDSSYSALLAAIATAESIYAKESATETEVNNALIGINTATSSLVKKSEDPDETEPPIVVPTEDPTAVPTDLPSETTAPSGTAAPSDYQYSITNVRLYDGVLRADIKYSGESGNSSAKLITAAYDSAGVLTDLDTKDISGDTKLEVSSFTLPENGIVRLYIWESLESIKPLSETVQTGK